MFLNDARAAAADDDIARATLAAAEWTSDDREDNWLISYADLLSVIFTMVVLLFGRMTVVAEQPAAQPAVAEPVAEVVAAPDAPPIVRIVSSPAAAPEPFAEATLEPSAVVPEPVADAPSEPSAVASRVEASAVAPLSELAPSDSVSPDAAQDESLPLPDGPSREDRVADLIEQRFGGQIAATRREHGLEITIPEVALFASARAVLQESAQPVLAELAATLREGGETRISVEGHTDNVPVQGGQFASNWDLASARANAVARYLLEHGFEPWRLQSVSYADTRPVASNDNVAGRAANRRVELQIAFVGD
jgi:chemotaxis protein MotB